MSEESFVDRIERLKRDIEDADYAFIKAVSENKADCNPKHIFYAKWLLKQNLPRLVILKNSSIAPSEPGFFLTIRHYLVKPSFKRQAVRATKRKKPSRLSKQG